MPGLSALVRDYRFDLMLDFMSGNGFDALAFTGSEWFEWGANHPVRELAWERPYLLVITADRRSFAFIAEQSRYHIEISRQRGSLWIESVEFFSESPSVGDGWTALQWPEMVRAALLQAGLGSARIGIEALTGPMAAVKALLPELELVPLDRSIRRLRWVKHRDEIETMRLAAGLSDWGMQAYREELRPGRLLAEIDFSVSAKLAAEAARRAPGADYVIGPLTTLPGSLSACPKGDGATNGRTLEADSTAVTTIPTRLNGLAMESARTWLIGSASAEEIRLFECVAAAQQAAIDQLVAGRRVCDIHRAAQSSLDADGLGHHLRLRGGHGIGVSMHDFPEDVPFEGRALLAGETYAVEPGVYIRGVGGFRFADTVAVGDRGPDQLTNAPKDRRSQTIN